MGESEKKRYPRVIVFTTPTCTFCRQAKKYLRQRGVPFMDVDVSRDAAAARFRQVESRPLARLAIEVWTAISSRDAVEQ
jgi:arsenate reductase-like glutaredoxin family protein